ncbi:Actin-2 [Taphrina deformans PYCC 5710]|uniref:Centractin n=1 Tax=Taphrina deformans (strain PYCC 5710 / ATCC 11124 / CBS 356.35 / IMI 108563 / JCM 9778 / NBRC 8474) TaxID=1097556 RepID=R4XDJ1_TAPDE|nr:Actin-2 [Taphrina deformans PYCC 5710]|eukprot:CCG81414.1 Actin-2 [Taphrina deformans PYCC 5710]
MLGSLEGDCFIGSRIQELRGLLKIKYPLEHGIVTDWSDMERIWSYIYSEELKIQSEDHPVLLTEAPHNPRSNRDTAAQLLFETFNIPALYVSIQAVLSLYASGRTTGIVLDSGDGVTHAVPVFEGFSVTNAIQRIDLAGRDVTDYLQLLLRKESGVRLTTSAETEIVKEIKERECYLTSDYKKETREWLTRQKRKEYKLPDGQVVELGSERWNCNEILFDPELIGSESEGLHSLVVNSINRVDLDLRKQLFQNIVLSGGTTMTRGFGDRLLREVKQVAVKDLKIKIYAPPERKITTWIGGSILASLSTFRKMWVSAEEYNENPELIHTKCM